MEILYLVHLVDAEVIVLLREQLEQHLDPVILARKPHIDSLGEPPEHCVIQILHQSKSFCALCWFLSEENFQSVCDVVF